MKPTSESDSRTEGNTWLAIGDVHLGTRPASLPANLEEYGVDPSMLTPEAALNATVDRAIQESVDGVLFAGDVVESTNARFEALRPLERAVGRLSEAGIPVVGVAGNHDVEALPRLARLISGFKLVGEGGRWESHVLEIRGRPALDVVGWSFPEREVRNSPVAELLRTPLAPSHAGIPRIGLLHGDLDASGGHYAPFSRREIEETALDAWLLGHIHKPSLGTARAADGAVPIGYLGSLVGLDPSETGPHGPWLIRVNAGGQIIPEQLPIAPLRWERLEVRVGETDNPEDLADRLLDEAERLGREIGQSGCAPRALGVRARLVGSTRHFEGIRGRIEQGTWSQIARIVGEPVVFIDKVVDGLELAVDLDELARGDDPPALLARKLIALERADEAGRALLDSARNELRPMAADTRWAPLVETRDAEDLLSDASLTAFLKQSGTAALHALLSQRESRETSAGERS